MQFCRLLLSCLIFEFSFVPRSCQDEKTYFFTSLLYFFTKFIVSVAQHRSAESEGLRFDSSKGLFFFSLSHARDKTKKHLSQHEIR